jgi:hypothetical protein
MYVLDSRVQGGQKAEKWSSRSRLAIYLGPSMNHSRSVGLALSFTTGLVSPQYHVRYDDEFQTVQDSIGPVVHGSDWQYRCGFTEEVPPHDVPIMEIAPNPTNIPMTRDDNQVTMPNERAVEGPNTDEAHKGLHPGLMIT